MKNFSRIFKYLSNKKGEIALYFLFNLLSIVFSLVSLAMLAPFLQLLFGSHVEPIAAKPAVGFSASGLLDLMKYYFNEMIISHSTPGSPNAGKLYALSVICVVLIVTIFLKNLFLYLTFRIQSPLRN
ncbi:MAG TPA: ABC transporter ATP-binding protein, partial [Flavihumibacter sp.]|nr:ABC transporter ATP-binding protein [Flavihumibacter sp.]